MQRKTCKRRFAGRAGFTLVEMLAVVFIIALLASLAFPFLSVIRNRAWRTRAHQQAQQVAQAWNAYLLDHRRWPDNAGQIDRMDRQTCEMLNASRTYLEIDADMRPYGFVDPWGQRVLRDGRDPSPWQIRVVLDHDHDGSVSYYGQTVRRSVIAWSVGPDGESGTDADVITWPRREES